MKNIIRSLSFAAFAAVGIFAAGCASQTLIQHPVTTHVVQISGKVINAGIVEDPVTGQNSVGYKTGWLTVTTIPLTVYSDTNGVAHYAVPPVCLSFEVAGKGILFGSAGSTYTLATGDSAVNSMLGGAHLPVNNGFYGPNNMMTYAAPGAVANPVVATTSTGTNGATTTTPIVINPTK
jgi:hypothetical protein